MRSGCRSAIIGPGMCSRPRSLARQGPRTRFDPFRCMAPSAGWVARALRSQGCSARWFISRLRCYYGCGCGAATRGMVEDLGCRDPVLLDILPLLRSSGRLVGGPPCAPSPTDVQSDRQTYVRLRRYPYCPAGRKLPNVLGALLVVARRADDRDHGAVGAVGVMRPAVQDRSRSGYPVVAEVQQVVMARANRLYVRGNRKVSTALSGVGQTTTISLAYSASSSWPVDSAQCEP